MTQLLQKILLFDCKLTHLMGADNRIANYLSRPLADSPNELSDREFNSKQLSNPPHDSDQPSNSDTDKKVNNVCEKMKIFQIFAKKTKCLQTNSVQ